MLNLLVGALGLVVLAATPGEGVLSGRILHRGEPVEAQLTIIQNGVRLFAVDTDLKGAFHIDDIKSGKYVLEVESHENDGSRIDRIEISVPEKEAQIDVELASHAGLIAVDTVPLEQSGRVMLYRGRESPATLIRSVALTDGLSFEDLEPGRYIVYVNFDDGNAEARCARANVNVRNTPSPVRVKMSKTVARPCPSLIELQATRG